MSGMICLMLYIQVNNVSVIIIYILASIHLIDVLSLTLARKNSSSPLVASAAVRSLAEVMLLLSPLLLRLFLMFLLLVVAVIRCYCCFHCGVGVSVKSLFLLCVTLYPFKFNIHLAENERVFCFILSVFFLM